MAVKDIDKKSIAYELLVELLAHQFAFPVQWINTQESLLAARDAVRRIVEFGPSKTLTSMGQKTIKRMIASAQRPLDPSVQFFATSQDAKELCYEYDAPHAVEDEEPADDQSSKDMPAPQQQLAVPARAPTPAAPVASVVIEDVSPTAEQIVQTLIARKLGKSLAEVSTSRSIRELCGGKSTLQNELVGDLHEEFSNLPDRPEDVSLKEIGAAASTGTEIKLGKISSALVSKLASSKMPARFSADSIRKHLASKWSLGPLRQMGVLLFSLVSEPKARIPTVNAAEQYWDEMCTAYAQAAGITLEVQVNHAVDDVVNAQSMHPPVSAESSKAHRKMASRQLDSLAEFLQVDLAESSGTSTEDLTAELQQRLDSWTAEFSEDFLSQIAPKFEPRTRRRFNSWWNTARQDLFALVDGHGEQAALINDEPRLEAFTAHICNRSDEKLATMARSLSSKARRDKYSTPQYLLLLTRVEQAIASSTNCPPRTFTKLPAHRPRTTVSAGGIIEYHEEPRDGISGTTAYAQLLSKGTLADRPPREPFACIRSSHEGAMQIDWSHTAKLLDRFYPALDSGVSFANQDVLVTGAGPNSIGAEVVRLLLMGGARVLVTTSREPSATSKYFQRMYAENGAKGSELILLRFNQASASDCERLIDHVYDADGLNRDIDAFLPFAATPESGTEIQDVGEKNELAHRLMLTNVHRLLGRIIKNKRERDIDCHPTQVLLPLSPNHGVFGGDGMYAESKLGLESLLNRVQSESWSDELSICGVKIGWTRSTGLMNANDIVAEAVEDHGVLTFSVQEMAFNIAMLMTPDFIDICESGPIVADFGGALGALDNCGSILSKAREKLNAAATVARAVQAENDEEMRSIRRKSEAHTKVQSAPKSVLKVGFPRLPDHADDIESLQQMQGLNDPANAVVVVGFSELGPWGNSRIRWEMEKEGRLTQAGYIELAWMMGLIKHFDGQRPDGYYVGWVDAKTGNPVRESDIEKSYGEHIAAHTGIRWVDPDTAGFDPLKKESLEEIAIEEDLPEYEVPAATAEAFRLRHGDNVSIRQDENSDVCRVQIKRGATIMVPKATEFRWGSVAGQLPAGFSPERYGIPSELVHQLDPVTLYAVCCVSEAFYSAGMDNPLEIYKHIHLSEIGNFLGSSMGGALKTKNLYKDIYMDKQVQADVLQDTYLNATAAWINMLLLGSTGPIKTPVGACATGVESIDSAVESIKGGKTKICLVGGFDDLQEDEAFGFAQMKATADGARETANGRLPSEMSRPTSESRAGFVEAEGCGVQILCRADLALEMGLPIYAVIAGSTMAADKIGRSVPAPGQGVLTFAKESRAADGFVPPYLEQRESSSPSDDVPLSTSTSSSNGWSSSSRTSTISSPPDESPVKPSTPVVPLHQTLASAPTVNVRRPIHTMSPLRAALATWGLGVDDLDVVSLHGTSTKANDLNEAEVICKQMSHLGRDVGRPLWAICQKSITGHPKAPAAAWMLNGCLQVLQSNTIPGNRNADNVDPALRGSQYICYPTRAVRAREVKAFLLNSFGFGQKGGQIVGVAPKYLFAALSPASFEQYREKTTKRTKKADRAFAKALMANQIVKVQTQAAYQDEDASRIMLDPLSRISTDKANSSYHFASNDLRGVADAHGNLAKPEPLTLEIPTQALSGGVAEAAKRSQAWVQTRMANGMSDKTTVGIDLVTLSTFTSHENPTFLARNYTAAECEVARQHQRPAAAFAGRWCGKEAVFKCLQAPSKGGGAEMRDIEILSDSGMPKVVLHGDAALAARNAGIRDVQVSLSYEEDCVVAVALGITG